MKTLQVWFFKILWWFTFVVLALIIIALAYRNTIATQVVENKIRNGLGLDAEVGDFSFGVLEPKATFTNLKLFNSADFGGTLFLDIPDLHIEYDRAALRHHEIHITLMRVNVKELDVVKNAEGVTNIFPIAKIVLPPKPGGDGRMFAPPNGYQFTGIDMLNISIGTAKFIDLKTPSRNRMLAVGIQNETIANVKSPADLTGLKSLLWYRGGYLVGLPVSRPQHTSSNTNSNSTATNEVNAAQAP